MTLLETPCLLCTCGTNENGYGVRWYHGKTELAHRVAYVEAHGLTMADIAGVVIRHRCDTPACIEPTHLVPGTQLDNVSDRNERQRQARGESVGGAVLKEQQVREIRGSCFPGVYLAKKYGVHPTTITRIKAGRHWNHLDSLTAGTTP